MTPKRNAVRSDDAHADWARFFSNRTMWRGARAVQDVIDRNAVFSMMFTCAALAAIVPLLSRYPFVAFLSIPLVLILESARKGLFVKQVAAHRNRGFDLLLAVHGRDSVWDGRLLELSWEEALRAFDVIQPRIFNRLYERHPLLSRLRLREPFRSHTAAHPLWFRESPHDDDLRPLSSENTLADTTRQLHFMMILAALPLLITTVLLMAQMISGAQTPVLGYASTLPLSVRTALMVPAGLCLGAYLLGRVLRDRSELCIVETGLLSPHAMSVLWRAAIKAHLEVVANRAGDETYREALEDKARHIANRVEDIYAWFEERRGRERRMLDEGVNRSVALQINFADARDDLFSPLLHLNPLRGELLDVSVDGSGLGIFANLNQPDMVTELEQLPTDAEVTLNLPPGSGLGNIPLKGSLKNMTHLGAGNWRMGVAIENRCHLRQCVHHLDATEYDAAMSEQCVMCDNYLVQQWYRNQMESPDIPIN